MQPNLKTLHLNEKRKIKKKNCNQHFPGYYSCSLHPIFVMKLPNSVVYVMTVDK